MGGFGHEQRRAQVAGTGPARPCPVRPAATSLRACRPRRWSLPR
jgi:hypothetical protein